MVVRDLPAGRLFGGRGKRHVPSVFGPIHGQDNSFHPQPVKAEGHSIASLGASAHCLRMRQKRSAAVCQGTSRSTLKSRAASNIFQQTGFAKLLRLVFDTAALRGSARMRPKSTRWQTQGHFRFNSKPRPYPETRFRLRPTTRLLRWRGVLPQSVIFFQSSGCALQRCQLHCWLPGVFSGPSR